MFSSYSTLFLQLEGLRHCSPSKPYTNKEGLPQKRACAEECKVYLCTLAQDPTFIKLCPFLSIAITYSFRPAAAQVPLDFPLPFKLIGSSKTLPLGKSRYYIRKEIELLFY